MDAGTTPLLTHLGGNAAPRLVSLSRGKSSPTGRPSSTAREAQWVWGGKRQVGGENRGYRAATSLTLHLMLFNYSPCPPSYPLLSLVWCSFLLAVGEGGGGGTGRPGGYLPRLQSWAWILRGTRRVGHPSPLLVLDLLGLLLLGSLPADEVDAADGGSALDFCLAEDPRMSKKCAARESPNWRERMPRWRERMPKHSQS
jgi:hypothetical protein